MNVTSEGRPYLGAAIGTSTFVEKHVSSKVNEWSSSVNTLSDIAKSQPQAAFSALTHGLLNKWTYLSRVLPNIGHLLLPLDDALRTKLLPTVTGRPAHNDLECDLFALPARQGGLGIRVPSKAAERELLASQNVTLTLRDHILAQDNEYSYSIVNDQMQAKSEIRQENRQRDQDEAERIYTLLPDRLQKAVTLAREKGASTWLTALPLTEHGFTLHKSAFHDALALRYGLTPAHLPSKCACGNNFSVEHALSCAKGGFPTIRHNEIRDITASLLTEVRNQNCSLSHRTNSLGLRPIPKKVRGSMCQLMESGVADIRKPFLM